MKKFGFTIIFLILIAVSFGQISQPNLLPNFQQAGTPTTWYRMNGVVYAYGGIVSAEYSDTVSANFSIYKVIPGIIIRVGNKLYFRNSNATGWIEIGAGGTFAFNGNRAITRDFSSVTGVNLGTTDLTTTMEALLYPSQVPTSSLTATYSAVTASGFDLELMSAGAALAVTLNWTGGRQASTATLSTINVGGTNQSFSQPAAPGSVSGTKSTTVTRNTNTSFTNLVTTSDSKTASSGVAFNFYPKRYWGYSTTSPPSSGTIITAAGGSGELTTSKSKSTFSIVVSGSNKYVYYAYPSSYGALTSIIISGIESIGAFTSSTVSVTNASGYVQNYIVYVSNNIFSSVTVNFNSVN